MNIYANFFDKIVQDVACSSLKANILYLNMSKQPKCNANMLKAYMSSFPV